METRLNLLIRDRVKENEDYFTKNIGVNHSTVEFEREHAVMNVVNSIRHDIEIDYVGEKMFDEIMAIITDSITDDVTFDGFEFEAKRIARLSHLSTFNSVVSEKELLDKIDWLALQERFEGSIV